MKCARCLAHTKVRLCSQCGKYVCEDCMVSDICLPCRIRIDARNLKLRLLIISISGAFLIAAAVFFLFMGSKPSAEDYTVWSGSTSTNSSGTPSAPQSQPRIQNSRRGNAHSILPALRHGLQLAAQKTLDTNEDTSALRIKSVQVARPAPDSAEAKSGCDYVGIVTLTQSNPDLILLHYSGTATDAWVSTNSQTE